jgi:hypothetical protein
MGQNDWIHNNFMRTGYALMGIATLVAWLNDDSPEAIEQRRKMWKLLRQAGRALSGTGSRASGSGRS